MNILMTGSTGFVGSHLKKSLPSESLRIVSRAGQASHNRIIIPTIDSRTNWGEALQDIDVVIHLAGVAHVSGVSSDVYSEVNTNGAINLAQQAASKGVRRFIFMSSIGVNGRNTNNGIPFTSSDTPNPHNPYSVSKCNAEKQLLKIGQETGLEVVILRAPLIYGFDAPGNFAALMNLVAKNIPLPFKSMGQNKRSFVSIFNLVHLVKICMEHANAAGQVFLVSDGEDLSTRDLVYKMSLAFGQRGWLWPMPIWCYKVVGEILGREAMVAGLVDSLQVDISHTQKILGWTPPQSVDDGIKRAIEGYIQSRIVK